MNSSNRPAPIKPMATEEFVIIREALRNRLIRREERRLRQKLRMFEVMTEEDVLQRVLDWFAKHDTAAE